VSIRIHAAVLQAPGLLDALGKLATAASHEAGFAISSEKLPERVVCRTGFRSSSCRSEFFR
jgi:hypothetical protein